MGRFMNKNLITHSDFTVDIGKNKDTCFCKYIYIHFRNYLSKPKVPLMFTARCFLNSFQKLIIMKLSPGVNKVNKH